MIEWIKLPKTGEDVYQWALLSSKKHNMTLGKFCETIGVSRCFFSKSRRSDLKKRDIGLWLRIVEEEKKIGKI